MSASSAAVGEEKGSPDFVVAHHFEKADTQFDAGRLGIWLFLVTEILFFGGMFCAFFIYRNWYYDSFVEAHHHLNKLLGALNTIFLITSSLTMALGVRAAQRGKSGECVRLLAITFVLAGAFLVVKYFEYTHKIAEGLLPGGHFTAPHGTAHPGTFFAVYFIMTGIHGLHVVIGMGLITWILLRAAKGEFSGRYYAPVEGVGLYWHLVDLIWIYLFPLLYLIG